MCRLCSLLLAGVLAGTFTSAAAEIIFKSGFEDPPVALIDLGLYVGGVPQPSPAMLIAPASVELRWSAIGDACTFDGSNAAAAALPGWGGAADEACGSAGECAVMHSVMVHVATEGSYEFGLKCTIEALPWQPGSIATESVIMVVEPPPPDPGVSCNDYLSSLSPNDRAIFTVYKAETRGFGKVERGFVAFTGKKPGADVGLIPNPLPGVLAENQYLALTFSLPLAGAQNSGKFVLNLAQPLAPVIAHDVSVAISPCPGDFRPIDNASVDHYLHSKCRNTYGMAGSVRGNSSFDPSWCPTPAGQVMYLNIGMRNMYTNYAVPIPASNCPGGQACGIRGFLTN